ncbi:MAG: hypothetical protein ABR559_00470 [Gemmatimonadota bacterium]
MSRRPGFSWALAVLVPLLLAAPGSAFAQFGALRDAAKKVTDRTPNLGEMLQGDPPITTSLVDAIFGVDSLDSFDPQNLTPLTDLERTENGGFLLQPGSYEIHGESYCLKAGTHGPGGGDGYLFASTAGPAADAVLTILHGAVEHPEIHQHDIQVLLWAIIARAKFEDLSSELKVTAAKLLTPEELARLNRSALDLVPAPVLQRALQSMPPLVRQVLEAEARLRSMLTQPGMTFEQLEAVAVLAGLAPEGEGSRQVPSGRWSYHPTGYYIRFLPRGYTYTVTQIWVPEDSPAVGQEYDPAGHIAVPGNTARQRLIQSGRVQQQT